MTLGISVGRIKENEVEHLEGYAWKTDDETKRQFEMAKRNQIAFIDGAICLDLEEIDDNGILNILETITISEEEYQRIRGE